MLQLYKARCSETTSSSSQTFVDDRRPFAIHENASTIMSPIVPKYCDHRGLHRRKQKSSGFFRDYCRHVIFFNEAHQKNHYVKLSYADRLTGREANILVNKPLRRRQQLGRPDQLFEHKQAWCHELQIHIRLHLVKSTWSEKIVNHIPNRKITLNFSLPRFFLFWLTWTSGWDTSSGTILNAQVLNIEQIICNIIYLV